MNRRHATAIAAAFCAALLASPAEAQRTRLTVYSALENEQLAPFKQAFESANRDVELVWVRDSTGVITTRLLAEKDNARADAIWGLSVFSLQRLEQDGLLHAYTPIGAEALRPQFRSAAAPMTWTGMDAFVSAVCVNTVVSKQKNLPAVRTWNDLLDPAFRGLITMPNPASSGTGLLTVAGWIGSMGEEGAWQFMTRLHENVAVYTHSGSAPCNNAGRGEYAVGLSFDMRAVTLKNQGAPIDIVVPTDGVGFDLEGAAIVRGSRNLAAAQKLMDFSVSKAANELYGRFYALVALPGVTPSVQGYPAEFEQRLGKVDFATVAANRDRILAEWSRRFDAKSAPRN